VKSVSLGEHFQDKAGYKKVQSVLARKEFFNRKKEIFLGTRLGTHSQSHNIKLLQNKG